MNAIDSVSCDTIRITIHQIQFGRTAIMMAAGEDHIYVALKLQKLGADIQQQDKVRRRTNFSLISNRHHHTIVP